MIKKLMVLVFVLFLCVGCDTKHENEYLNNRDAHTYEIVEHLRTMIEEENTYKNETDQVEEEESLFLQKNPELKGNTSSVIDITKGDISLKGGADVEPAALRITIIQYEEKIENAKSVVNVEASGTYKGKYLLLIRSGFTDYSKYVAFVTPELTAKREEEMKQIKEKIVTEFLEYIPE